MIGGRLWRRLPWARRRARRETLEAALEWQNQERAAARQRIIDAGGQGTDPCWHVLDDPEPDR